MNLVLLISAAFVAVVLISVILIQNPKTGNLEASLNARQLTGVAQSHKFVEKTTWGLAVLMLGLCLTVGIII